MKNLRFILSALSIALIVVFFWIAIAGCGSDESREAAAKAKAVAVITAPVQKQEVVYTLEQVGNLEASDRAKLRSQVAAAVAGINFHQGAAVQKGEILVRLDDAKIQAEIRNLLARIEQLKVRLAFKSKTLERNRSLLKKSAIPLHRFDEISADVKETELAISQVQADLARQREMLAYTVIRAPFAGVVGSKQISVGDYLKVGDQVVEVVVLDPLETGFQVPERYKARLSLGQKVGLRVASEPERVFDGVIFFISPTVDEKTRTFLVKAKVANADQRLNPGMFARVSLVTQSHAGASVVPWESVIQTEKETYIYLVEDGRARKKPIQLGKVTNDWAEVLSPGLKAGGLVIVEGKFAAKDGAEVQIKKTPQPTPSAKQ